jgi:type II secretory pathway pseudopilin PulG
VRSGGVEGKLLRISGQGNRMMPFGLDKLRNSRRLSLLKDEDGYLLIVVTIIGLILAVIFGLILPQLHTGQQTRAINNLNEYRAYEAARKGSHAVRLGLKDLNNLQDLTGYTISGATPNITFAINGNYASLFPSGVSVQVYYSSGNDGEYTVTGATNFPTGVTTEITVEQTFSDDTGDGVLCRNRGVFWAIDRLCGATIASTNHDEYRDEDGNVQFVSGCKGIDLPDNEDGRIDVFVIVSRNGVVNTASDGDPKNDGWFFHDTNSGVSWVSVDRWPATMDINYYRYKDGTVHYFDFDGTADLSTTYLTNADVKWEGPPDGKWKLAIGHNGSYRRTYGATQLWNLEKDFITGTTPFQGRDNNADGEVKNDDKVEVFVIVRSTGITAAPGTNYDADKTDLRLVREANSHLPNPMRQVLGAGFTLEEQL